MAIDTINKRRSILNRITFQNLPWPAGEITQSSRAMRLIRYAFDSFGLPVPFPPNCLLAAFNVITGMLAEKVTVSGLLTPKDPITGTLDV